MSSAYRPSSWLVAFSKNKEYCDPRSFEVHRTVDNAFPIQPNHNAPGAVSEWNRATAKSMSITGFDPLPSDPVDDSDSKTTRERFYERCPSSDQEFEPLQLEAIPPLPVKCPDNSLFSLRTQIQQNSVLYYDIPSLAQEQSQTRSSISSDSTTQETQYCNFGKFQDTSFPAHVGNGLSSQVGPVADSFDASSDGTLVEKTGVGKFIAKVVKKTAGAKKLCLRARSRQHDQSAL
ncbi:uncharacterized protein N7498_005460 [Penicillium cinerascens]|uniref:Uncharacterized protein n=1 Tax=Penicillium cinerascens TaxID=70096 RepID=A0A9W9MNE7_9EURO|nr:uncharacterized protein N7498_005460 [Penicillium cinerascens]KAJ5204581.1 hypothetical protein N7498_005460 [Penicillium cinerascens]